MKKQDNQRENPRRGAAVRYPTLVQLLFPALCRKGLRGLSLVVADDPAELALAADSSHGLWPEAGIEHVVSDLAPLMRPLRVVMSEPQRHNSVELLGREADEVVEALVLEGSDEAFGICRGIPRKLSGPPPVRFRRLAGGGSRSSAGEITHRSADRG